MAFFIATPAAFAARCPDWQAQNTCQPPSAGGHMGTIQTVVKDGKTYCAKVVKAENDAELRFYETQCPDAGEKHPLCVAMPQFGGVCDAADGQRWFLMENLKSGFAAPASIDIKIGFSTATQTDSDLLKRLQMKLVDQWTQSSTRGWRIASKGVTIDSWLAAANLRRGDAVRCIARELEVLLGRLEEEMTFKLVGSSLLLTFDATAPSSCRVTMIDFAHGWELNAELAATTPDKRKDVKSNIRKWIDQYRMAVGNLHLVFDVLVDTVYSVDSESAGPSGTTGTR